MSRRLGAFSLLSLFPFICHFKLGRRYLWMNSVTLLMTLSTFGFVAAFSFCS